MGVRAEGMLFRKPVSTPDQVRGMLFWDHALIYRTNGPKDDPAGLASGKIAKGGRPQGTEEDGRCGRQGGPWGAAAVVNRRGRGSVPSFSCRRSDAGDRARACRSIHAADR